YLNGFIKIPGVFRDCLGRVYFFFAPFIRVNGCGQQTLSWGNHWTYLPLNRLSAFPESINIVFFIKFAGKFRVPNLCLFRHIEPISPLSTRERCLSVTPLGYIDLIIPIC